MDRPGHGNRSRGGRGGNLFTLQLTPEQQETFAGAQLIVLAALDMDNGIYGTQITSTDGAGKGDTVYAPVYVTEAGMDKKGRLSEDGSAYSIHGLYQDRSGREDFAGDLDVLFELKPGEGDELVLSGVRGYDSATQTYTSRIPVEEKLYTDLQFYPDTRKMPEDPEQLPGFERWKQKSRLNVNGPSIRLPSAWKFRFFPDQMSACQLYAAFQVTDTQRSVHMSRPAAVDNPNLENIAVTPGIIETEDCRIRIHLLRNDSPMQPGIDLIAEATNQGPETELMILDPILMNGTRDAAPGKLAAISFTDLAPGETRVGILHIDRTALTGIESVSSLTARLKVRPENREKTERDLAFAVAPLETGAVSEDGSRPLARTEEDGIVWELRGLEQNRYGDLTGLMRIENTRDEPLEGFGTLAVNGLLIHGSATQRIRVAPHAAGYLPFTLNNSAVLKYPLSLNGRSHRFWLATRDTIPLYGIREIREIQIMMDSGYRVEHCPVLTPSTPWPLSSSEETEAAAGIPLITGEVEAFVERVLRAENGIGIRAVFENHREQPVSVGIGYCSLNGTATGDSGHSLMIPAGGRTVYTFAMQREEGTEESITEAGMSFQINREYGTPDAVIHLNPEAGTGYLDPSEIRIDTVAFRQPRVTVLNPEQEVEGACGLSLSGTILSGSQEIFDSDWYDFDQKHLRLTLQLENTTDRPQFYVGSELTVNGTTVTDRHFIPGSAAPGEKITDQCVIDLSGLGEITEIQEISFNLSWYPTDKSGSRQTVSLCFRFGDGGLRLPIR